MVRQSAPLADQRIAIGAADEAIQQAVPMDVAGLFPAKKETDAAESMHADPHPGPSANLCLDFANRAEARGMKQPGGTEQQRVEQLRRTRNLREPFQPADDERKNQAPFSSIGARSATDGPFNTLPTASNRDP
jgi:hypothetical protein